MATFLTLQQELADRLGPYDQAVSADATKLKRWLNLAQQYICGKRHWPFMLASEIVQTETDYTTGTVFVTNGTTGLTFSGAITGSRTGHYIRFSTSNNWHKIVSHTGGADIATMTPAGITLNVAATFTIRKLHYTTATPMIQILDMKQLVTPTQIQGISPLAADAFLPLYSDAGTVNNYIMSVPTTAGAQQFSFFNSPSSVMNIMVRGIKALADLSADGDLSLIPSLWHDALVHIAAFYGFQTLDDTRAKDELQAGEIRIEDMRRNYLHDAGRHRVMGSGGGGSDLGWNLPPYNDYGSE